MNTRRIATRITSSIDLQQVRHKHHNKQVEKKVPHHLQHLQARWRFVPYWQVCDSVQPIAWLSNVADSSAAVQGRAVAADKKHANIAADQIVSEKLSVKVPVQ